MLSIFRHALFLVAGLELRQEANLALSRSHCSIGSERREGGLQKLSRNGKY